MHLPEQDRSYRRKREMQEEIIVLLGGRVAESLILEDISTGASNDIERATQTARAMVTRYGFSERLGPIVYGESNHEVFLGRDFSSTPSYSDNVAAEIDAEIREIIDRAYERCTEILKNNMDKLHLIAKFLLVYEKIDGEMFQKLMNGELGEADLPSKEKTEAESSDSKDSQAATEETSMESVEEASAEEDPVEDSGQSTDESSGNQD